MAKNVQKGLLKSLKFQIQLIVDETSDLDLNATGIECNILIG